MAGALIIDILRRLLSTGLTRHRYCMHASVPRVRPHDLVLATSQSPMPVIMMKRIRNIMRGKQPQQLSCDQTHRRVTKMCNTRRSSDNGFPRGFSLPLSMAAAAGRCVPRGSECVQAKPVVVA